MSSRYHQGRISGRWQEAWAEAAVYEVDPDADDPIYVLGMFPYTSGSIHMGHVRNYSITDAYARFRRMQGDDVLHPMGWDAFGLPAENAAHERDIDPASWTEHCIEEMRQQLRDLGFGYDWSREITTCEPDYYRWNQWLFNRLYAADLVDHAEATVNWCPDCETVLADAQVELATDEDVTRIARPRGTGDTVTGSCWRCGTTVVPRSLPQWFFRITEYADELADGLDELADWPESVRDIQRHWIGRQEGANVTFELSNGDSLTVFSARPDTIYGATYLAVSASHPIAEQVSGETAGEAGDDENWWGIETDIRASHPLTGEDLPVWIAGYVVPEVGTGAVMGVPAHDERDFEFARNHELPMRTVVVPADGSTPDKPFTDDGRLQGGGDYDGLDSETARERLRDEPAIESATTFRLRDWLISRQRYWGTPIPIVHCGSCGPVPVPDDELPVTLPPFEPSRGNPLAAVNEFVETTCPDCGQPAERETDTMDTFVDSSWYFLRFLSPHLDSAAFDAETARKTLPVDVYVGGAEHATLHLLYLRFIAKALADMDRLDVREPIERLLTQGTVLHGGQKMSKSDGNVVAPHEYGAETTRVFVLSAAHPERDFDWTDSNITHAYELQQDLYELVATFGPNTGRDGEPKPRDEYLLEEIDRTVVSVTQEFEAFNFHRAIAEIDQLGSLLRRYRTYGTPHRESYLRGLCTITRLIAPIAPFLAEELWQLLDEPGLVAAATWPESRSAREAYHRERDLVRQLRSDVREIVDVAGIDAIQEIEVTVAADWKFAMYELAYEARDAEAFQSTVRSRDLLGEGRDEFFSELSGQIAELEPVLSADEQLGLIGQASWLLDDEFGAVISIAQEDDDTGATPNRPGITIR